jgi:anti-sigma B factor antagonist
VAPVADLEVRAERHGPRARLTVAGELDLATAGVLREAAAAQLRSGELRELVLDLGGVTFLDSSGLGALLQVRGDLLSAGSSLAIDAVASGTARIIAIAGLAETFGLPAT